MRAGLWEKDVRLSEYGTVDFGEVYRLASEQSVVGLVAAGIEHIVDVKVPQEVALMYAGEVLQLEQRNQAMNAFIAELVGKMRKEDIYTLLVKGQGIAQSYERPSWRACGDVDLLLDIDNYAKATTYLTPLAQNVVVNPRDIKHIGMTIDTWSVELHGTLRSQLGSRIDKVIDNVQSDTFENNKIRVWNNGVCNVYLPAANNDIIFVFTHILQHYFNGGIGIRQVCDWCRLLWTYSKEIDVDLLNKRLSEAGIKTEWEAFAALAVDRLGIPAEKMPFYSAKAKWRKKANRIVAHVIRTGNMGHNRDTLYRQKDNIVIRKLKTLARVTSDGLRQITVFPLDAIKVWLVIVTKSIKGN